MKGNLGNVIDYSKPGTNMNSESTEGRFGEPDTARYNHATPSYITIPVETMKGLKDFTFSIWARIEVTSPELSCFLGVAVITNFAYDHVLFCNNFLTINRGTLPTDGIYYHSYSYPKIPERGWIHVSMVRDTANDNVSTFVNNKLFTSFTGKIDNISVLKAEEIIICNERNAAGTLNRDR